MYREFEVTWEGVLPAGPEQVWDAITARTAGWIWEIAYEPRVGGAEQGLSSAGGTVTAWDPARHLQTRAERSDGWRNALDYRLEPRGDGTLLRYVHNGMTSDYAVEYDACVQHTDFYYHSLGEYLRHFAGRDAAYAAAAGDRVLLEPAGLPELEGTVDYRTPVFLGVRTDDALVRVFGREAWGGSVTAYLHLFADDADPVAAERAWSASLGAAEAVA